MGRGKEGKERGRQWPGERKGREGKGREGKVFTGSGTSNYPRGRCLNNDNDNDNNTNNNGNDNMYKLMVASQRRQHSLPTNASYWHISNRSSIHATYTIST